MIVSDFLGSFVRTHVVEDFGGLAKSIAFSQTLTFINILYEDS